MPRYPLGSARTAFVAASVLLMAFPPSGAYANGSGGQGRKTISPRFVGSRTGRPPRRGEPDAPKATLRFGRPYARTPNPARSVQRVGGVVLGRDGHAHYLLNPAKVVLAGPFDSMLLMAHKRVAGVRAGVGYRETQLMDGETGKRLGPLYTALEREPIHEVVIGSDPGGQKGEVLVDARTGEPLSELLPRIVIHEGRIIAMPEARSDLVPVRPGSPGIVPQRGAVLDRNTGAVIGTAHFETYRQFVDRGPSREEATGLVRRYLDRRGVELPADAPIVLRRARVDRDTYDVEFETPRANGKVRVRPLPPGRRVGSWERQAKGTRLNSDSVEALPNPVGAFPAGQG